MDLIKSLQEGFFDLDKVLRLECDEIQKWDTVHLSLLTSRQCHACLDLIENSTKVEVLRTC